MALTAGQIIALAAEAAHCPGKTGQALAWLNTILARLCETYALAAARGQFFFNFNPSLNTGANLYLGAQFGSGPYPLPLDYLRMSDSSGSTGAQRGAIWYLLGVPNVVIPVDLAEFDLQIQQAGLNSYPWLWATDMASPIDDRIVLATTGDVSATGTTIANLANLSRLVPGQAVAGQAIVPGTTVVSVNTGNQSCVISQNGAENLLQASLMFGNAPVGFVYPPPSGALPVMLRYQRRMPNITDTTRYPWFTDDEHLVRKLTGHLCELVDDSRAGQLLAGPGVVGSPDHQLATWLAAKDDDTNRAKTVQLDRRVFGSSMRALKNTKTIGW